MSKEMQERLERNDNIRVKELRNGVSSYNFTRQTFWKRLWDEDTMTARGLFMRDGEVVARGFNKYFNVGEPDGYATFQEVTDTFEYPVSVTDKLNGFLVIVATIDDEVWVLSKSGETDYSEAAKSVLPMEALKANKDEFRGFSLVFEVILANDPHIVKYDREFAVLLGAIRNDEAFSMDDDVKDRLAEVLDVSVPQQWIAHDGDELHSLLVRAKNAIGSEGVVIRDAVGRMSKIKSDHYSEVKSLRRDIGRYRRHGEISDRMLRVLEILEEKGASEDDLFVESINGESINLPLIADSY